MVLLIWAWAAPEFCTDYPQKESKQFFTFSREDLISTQKFRPVVSSWTNWKHLGTNVVGGNAKCNLGCGTIYRLDKAGVLHVRYKFTGGFDGSQPFGPLVQDADGNVYGVTASPEATEHCPEFPRPRLRHSIQSRKEWDDNCLAHLRGWLGWRVSSTRTSSGRSRQLIRRIQPWRQVRKWDVFKIAKDGTYKVVHRFTGADGKAPEWRIGFRRRWKCFGTTQLGGSEGLGVAFQLKPSGQLKALHFHRRLGWSNPLSWLDSR